KDQLLVSTCAGHRRIAKPASLKAKRRSVIPRDIMECSWERKGRLCLGLCLIERVVPDLPTGSLDCWLGPYWRQPQRGLCCVAGNYASAWGPLVSCWQACFGLAPAIEAGQSSLATIGHRVGKSDQSPGGGTVVPGSDYPTRSASAQDGPAFRPAEHGPACAELLAREAQS